VHFCGALAALSSKRQYRRPEVFAELALTQLQNSGVGPLASDSRNKFYSLQTIP
jgi:hypothetical protein